MSNEPDLVQFLSKLDWGVSVLADLDACRRVAAENVQDAVSAGWITPNCAFLLTIWR